MLIEPKRFRLKNVQHPSRIPARGPSNPDLDLAVRNAPFLDDEQTWEQVPNLGVVLHLVGCVPIDHVPRGEVLPVGPATNCLSSISILPALESGPDNPD